MDRRSAWRILGIAATGDAREIRRAYARKLKDTNPEDDAQGFQELRAAYELALQLAAQGESNTPDFEAEAPGPPRDDTADDSYDARDARAEPATEQPADELMQQAKALFDALALELRRDERAFDERALQAAFDNLLLAPALHRFDIYQRVELAVAELLVNHIPRADPLVAAAVRHFEWNKRDFDASVPPAARGLVARLHDLEFLGSLKKADPRLAEAYRRLQHEKPGTRTWLVASLSTRIPELHLLARLRADHPNLFAQIPEETVQWWDEFARRPTPSRPLLVLGLIVTMVLTFIHLGNPGTQPAGTLLVALAGVGATASLMTFKLFAIEWPALLVQQRWHGDPPLQVSLGWLGLAILVVFEAMTAPGSALFGWTVAALGVGSWLWALYVAGPLQRMGALNDVLQTRMALVVLVNGIMLWWFAMISDSLQMLTAPTFIAIVFALLASGVGRPVQMFVFQGLRWQDRLAMCLAGMVLSIAMGIAVVFLAQERAAEPWIVAGAVSLTLLRRAMPHGMTLGGAWWVALLVPFGGYAMTAFLLEHFDLLSAQPDLPEHRPVIIGAILFLAGAVYAFGREAIETVMRKGNPRPAAHAA